mmetsp:Transcript_38358/g.56370  ORF Transcript_38358/g.56370 Transcript_38358/m.56370 type:complete len:200 (+) Transcript_38358:247-846(+)
MVAKVRGLPGFIKTRPKWMLPRFSSIGFTRSLSPIETPPVVTRTFAPWAIAASSILSRLPCSSPTMPMSSTVALSAWQAAMSMALFESRTVPRGSEPTGASTSASSSPVEQIATTACGRTEGRTMPTVASRPTSAGPTKSPAFNTLSPTAMSDAVSRIFCRALPALSTLTRSGAPWSFCVSSIITTASAPAGTHPPVVM